MDAEATGVEMSFDSRYAAALGLLALGLLLLICWVLPRQPSAGLAAQANATPAQPGLSVELLPEEPDIRAAMQAALDRWTATHTQAASLQLGSIWGQDDWAAGEVAVLPTAGGSEGTLVLARRVGDAWHAFLADEPSYVNILEAGPAALLPAGAVDWFRAQSTLQFSDTQGLYLIPFTGGTSVRVTCYDCYPGHYPSVDFQSLGDWTVRAARDGTVAAWYDAGDLCCCQSGCSACNGYLVLDHGDGEYSAYLHLASGSVPEIYRQVGTFVPRGAAIAQTGDTGYTCGSGRLEVGCGAVTPDPGGRCARHLHFEVRDAPFPYGDRLRPRFQDVYEQTDPPTYFVEQGRIYVSGNTPVTPTVTPTPTPPATATPTPVPTPTPGSCPPPAAPAGAYLFTEPNYCGLFSHLTAPAPSLTGTVVITAGVHSLYLAGPYTATLYDAPHYTGTAEQFLAGDPNLADNSVSTNTASLQVTLTVCPPISPGVILYTTPDYGGACRYFPTGTADLATVGLDDAARSLRLIGPYSVTLYSEANYTGTAETLFGSTPDLSGHPVAGTVSSLRLSPMPCNPQAEGVTLFAAPAYSGTCCTYLTDTASLSPTIGVTITSIQLRGPFRAILYSTSGFSGTAETFVLSDPDLRDNPISTTAGSLEVTAMPCRPWSEGITLFAGTDYTGACATLTEDHPDLDTYALAGHVWSVQVRGPYRATLYSAPGYSGTAEVFDRPDADLGDNPILSATASIRVEAITCTTGAGGVTLWAQPAYDGPCSTFRADDADLADDPIGAGNSFSLRVIGPYSVSLYPEVDFAGTRTVVLGDLPDLRGSAVGTRTATLRVTTLSETLRLWNDVRFFALPLAVPVTPTTYIQEIGVATAAPDDPPLSCAGFTATHTLWYRPRVSETTLLAIRAAGPASVTLGLWIEGESGLRELACAAGEGTVLEGLLPAGRGVLLEAVAPAQDAPGAAGVPLSLTMWRGRPWSIYLPLVLRTDS